MLPNLILRSHPGYIHPESTLGCLFAPFDRLEREGGDGEIENEVSRCLFSADHHFMDVMFVGSYIRLLHKIFIFKLNYLL